MEKAWKVNQKEYRALLRARSLKVEPLAEVTDDGGKIDHQWAMDYTHHAATPFRQPTKSRVDAIIYANLIARHFGVDFYEALNDSDLFLGEDPYFKPYSQDKEGYDLLIHCLGPYSYWRTKGWAICVNQFFWLECTEEGINFTRNVSQEDFQKFICFSFVLRNICAMTDDLLSFGGMFKTPTVAVAEPKPSIRIDREGWRFWHRNCTNQLGGVMSEIAREPDKSLIECLHCGEAGYYPVSGVGEICTEIVTSKPISIKKDL